MCREARADRDCRLDQHPTRREPFEAESSADQIRAGWSGNSRHFAIFYRLLACSVIHHTLPATIVLNRSAILREFQDQKRRLSVKKRFPYERHKRRTVA
jgi:hypothetical protein